MKGLILISPKAWVRIKIIFELCSYIGTGKVESTFLWYKTAWWIFPYFPQAPLPVLDCSFQAYSTSEIGCFGENMEACLVEASSFIR